MVVGKVLTGLGCERDSSHQPNCPSTFVCPPPPEDVEAGEAGEAGEELGDIDGALDGENLGEGNRGGEGRM